MLLYNEDILDIFDQAYLIKKNMTAYYNVFGCIDCLDTMKYMMVDVEVDYQASVIDEMNKRISIRDKYDYSQGYEEGYESFMNGHPDVLDDVFKRIKGVHYIRGWEAGYFDAQEEDREYDKIGC